MTKHDARYIKETYQDVAESVSEALASLRLLGPDLDSNDKVFFIETEKRLVIIAKGLDFNIKEMHHRYHLLAERSEL